MANIIPLYYQIKNTLNEWIVNREYSPGERLPSEHELSLHFGVNRLTVRRAIALLTQEGLLIARQGEGTFVTENEKLIDSYRLEFSGFMDDLFYQVSISKTMSGDIDTVKASKKVLEKLHLENKEENVVKISRVRYLREQSFAYTINYFPMDIGMRIKKEDILKKPILRIIENDLGIELLEAFQTIEASFADKKIAKLLEIEPGSPILFVERTMYSKNRKPVEFVQTSYRSDLYKYVVRLQKKKGRNEDSWVHRAE